MLVTQNLQKSSGRKKDGLSGAAQISCETETCLLVPSFGGLVDGVALDDEASKPTQRRSMLGVDVWSPTHLLVVGGIVFFNHHQVGRGPTHPKNGGSLLRCWCLIIKRDATNPPDKWRE